MAQPVYFDGNLVRHMSKIDQVMHRASRLPTPGDGRLEDIFRGPEGSQALQQEPVWLWQRTTIATLDGWTVANGLEGLAHLLA
jgi:hypothetical protein